MKAVNTRILCVNSGSSSIRFALYAADDGLVPLLKGMISGIAQGNTRMTFSEEAEPDKSIAVNASSHTAAANFFVDWLKQHQNFNAIEAVGHRVVHGMRHTQPELITEDLLNELHRISAIDPDHLPGEIELIKAFKEHYPVIPQFACFDTAFHADMPRVARLLPIPQRFSEQGVQRYGFHGISYSYIMEELARLQPGAVNGKIIIAHLGSGASITAVEEGKSIDTSMGFTPTGGLPMSTRTGDLDPGVAWYMMHLENMSVKQFNHLINHESGWLGISGSADMQHLLEQEGKDERCAEAINLFCYSVKKWIGAYTAVLAGVDTIIFTGGIGENAPEIRCRICKNLEYLGIELEEGLNNKNSEIISSNGSEVTVRVIRTNEELMIAKMVLRLWNVCRKNKMQVK